jgi:hypothetical protein
MSVHCWNKCCPVSISDVIHSYSLTCHHVFVYVCCNVHVVVLFRGSKGRCLVTTRCGTTMHDLFEDRSEKVFLYGPSLGYISRTIKQREHNNKSKLTFYLTPVY